MREWGARLFCFLAEVDEGIVDVVDVGATREDVVGGVGRGEEGDICIC